MSLQLRCRSTAAQPRPEHLMRSPYQGSPYQHRGLGGNGIRTTVPFALDLDTDNEDEQEPKEQTLAQQSQQQESPTSSFGHASEVGHFQGSRTAEIVLICPSEQFYIDNANSTQILLAMCYGLTSEDESRLLADTDNNSLYQTHLNKSFIPKVPVLKKEITRRASLLTKKVCMKGGSQARLFVVVEG
jgi:hypothetical protein